MLRCDFCGADADRVSRVALDKDYDRLTIRHEKRYACVKCSDKKEKERTGAPGQKKGKTD